MHAIHHAKSSARKWGGSFEEYLKFHLWFDESKNQLPDVRHRAMRHHTWGIEQLVATFGEVFENSHHKHVPVRYLGEQHVQEDLGCIPTLADWLRHMPMERWMAQPGKFQMPGGLRRVRRAI